MDIGKNTANYILNKQMQQLPDDFFDSKADLAKFEKSNKKIKELLQLDFIPIQKSMKEVSSHFMRPSIPHS